MRKFDPEYHKLTFQKKKGLRPPQHVINDLLLKYNANELKKYLRKLYEEKLYRSFFDKTAIVSEINEFIWNPLPAFPVERLLLLYANIIKLYSQQLNDFLRIRSEISKLIIQENFSEANLLLEKAKQLCGLSLWYYEMNFGILESLHGTEEQKKLRKSIMDKSTNPSFSFLINWLSTKCEDKLSRERLNREINEVALLYPFIAPYMKFKYNFINENQFDNLGNVLQFEWSAPIIDRYLTFIKVCGLILSDDKFKHLRESVAQAIEAVGTEIQDPNLINLQLLTFKPISKMANMHIGFLEKYTLGAYKELLTKENLPQMPIQLSANVCARCTTADELTQNGVYRKAACALRKPGSASALSTLGKLSARFATEDWAVAVLPYTKKHSGKDFELIHNWHYNLSTLFGFEANVNIIKIISNDEDRTALLEKLSHQNGDSITIKAFRLSEIEDISQKLPALVAIGVKKDRAVRMIAKHLLSSNISTEGLILLAEEINEARKSAEDIISAAELTKILTRVQQRLGDLAGAISTLVDFLILQPDFFDYMDIGKYLVDFCECDLETPEHHAKKTVLLDFVDDNLNDDIKRAKELESQRLLRSLKILKPSELSKTVIKDFKNLLIYLLEKIYTVDCINKIPVAVLDTVDVENERIMVLQQLIQLNPQKASLYYSEIAELTRVQFLRQKVREIENSKIFVDVNSIKKSNELKFKSDHGRLRALLDSELVLDFTEEDFKQVYELISQVENKNILDDLIMQIPKMESQRIFQNMLFEIRDKFISGEVFGLGCYLSSGLRHGTIGGQIRKSFLVANLIAKKDGFGQMTISKYWAEKYLANGSEFTQRIEKNLIEFTNEVESSIDKLNNEVVRIKTVDSEKGLFDFKLDDQETKALFMTLSVEREYENFMSGIFDFLWAKTKSSLAAIQQYINNEVKTKVLDAGANLRLQLEEINPRPVELIAALNTAITATTTGIDKLAEWFQLPRTVIPEDISIIDLIDVVIESIKNIAPNNRLVYEKTAPGIGNIYIKGEFFSQFYYIFFTLFENVAKHTELAEHEIKVGVAWNVDSSNVIIEIKNGLPKTIDVEKLASDMAIKNIELSNLSEFMKSVSSEGGTGFRKVKRILTFDLGVKNNLVINVNKEDMEFIVTLKAERQTIKCES